MRRPAPPTPAVPLADLLADPSLGLRQVAGPDTDVPVHAVHASEMRDPAPYLLGGELLLTAGAHITPADRPEGYFDHYAAHVLRAGAAALGFGLAPVHETMPRALVDACDRYGLPLVEVPPQTPFTAVARAVWHLAAERHHRELRRVADAQQALASAAARPGPVPAVLRQLARHLGGWAALLDADGAELTAAGSRPEAVVRRALAELAGVIRPATAGRGPTSATDTAGGSQLAVYALAGHPGEGLVLALSGARREPADHTIAGVAVVLLSLLTGPHQGTAEAVRTSALVRLLLGARPQDVTGLLAGAPPASRETEATAVPAPAASGEPGGEDAGRDRWTVVHARRRGAASGAGRTAAAEALAAATLATSLGSALADPGGAPGVPRTVRVLVSADREVAAQPGWTLGVSAPAAGADLAAADTQAAGALRRALAGRTALVRHRAVDAGVASLVPPDEALAQARAALGPILDPPALVETLRAWLALHGSWDRTAAALDIHRNTVRQRITRIAGLLGGDLDDPDTRMELWFALRWL